MSDLPRLCGSPIDASEGCSMGEQSLMQGRRAIGEDTQVFVGIDVAKLRNAVAIAEPGRDGEVRYFGEVDASESSMRQLIKKLAARHDKLSFCYEAGPTGYRLHRLITEMGHTCIVVAPSLIPKKPSDRIKTNRRDAISLARLLRAGELTAVWVPDTAHEALRSLRCSEGGEEIARCAPGSASSGAGGGL
jgi:transposase